MQIDPLPGYHAYATGAKGKREKVPTKIYNAELAFRGQAIVLNVAELPLDGPHEILIGRDILDLGKLEYDGPNRRFKLTLPDKS